MRPDMEAKLLVVVMSGQSKINRIAPAITPTLSSELVTNGAFTNWTGDDPDNWTVFGLGEDANNGVTEVSGACRLFSNGNLIGIRQDIGLTQYQWLQLQLDIDAAVAGSLVVKQNSGNEFWSSLNTTGTKVMTDRTTGTNALIVIQRNGTCDLTFDDFSVKTPTFSTCRSLMGSLGQQNGTYTCHPTVTIGTFAGMLIEYLDDNNFVYIMTNGSSAYMVKRVAGVDTTVKSGVIVYSAGAELKAVVNGTTHQLFYNNIQVSTDGTIDNSGLGTQVHAFNTYATNTVGLVTANP